MKTITEDYVSFEVAKLLKKKGFDVNAINLWHIVPSEICNFEDFEKVVCGDVNEPEYSKNYYPKITLQMAMKWLREVYNINLNISWSPSFKDYFVEIFKPTLLYSTATYRSYEEACEAAIKYCLNNLI